MHINTPTPLASGVTGLIDFAFPSMQDQMLTKCTKLDKQYKIEILGFENLRIVIKLGSFNIKNNVDGFFWCFFWVGGGSWFEKNTKT